MKRGFTLVEMLIVVVVLVTLMTITFRLSSIGEDQSARAKTISRMQRLENCLSGYNAAYGSYPPVYLYNSRNWRLPTSGELGDQDKTGDNGNIWSWDPDKFKSWVDAGMSGSLKQENEIDAWEQVRAACRAQPIECRFPFADTGDGDDYVTETLQAAYEYWEENGGASEKQLERLKSGADGLTSNVGAFSDAKDDESWDSVRLFKFGVLSYLLPRFQIMMRGNKKFFDNGGFAQWSSNNTRPKDPKDGRSTLSWDELWDDQVSHIYGHGSSNNGKSKAKAYLSMIPSEAVCARWLPNLEKSCTANSSCQVFGVEIFDSDGGRMLSYRTLYPEIYEHGGRRYMLDTISMKDSWGTEFFYYSPPPYQSYTVWSAGRNQRTFPTWVSRDTLDTSGRKCVSVWTEDDIIHMSN